jgi:EAL domain-containing protein (putative c-di-GMP-specific phosphodiesterase class I)
MGHVLLADDDAGVLRIYQRVLARADFEVATAGDGESALAALRGQGFDAIVSDIAMPGMSGIDLLRTVRERDLDVPVILMTGGSALKIAHDAIAFGATRLLLKPMSPQQLVDAVRRATGLYNLIRLQRQAHQLLDADDKLPSDAAALTVCFERALSSLWLAYQPIVAPRERRIHAYQVLLRSDEPALERPDLIFAAAERLGRVVELGRRVRTMVARAARAAPPGPLYFVNVHCDEIGDDDLVATAAPLSSLASRVVLEISERTSLARVPDLAARIAALRLLGFGIAIDAIGEHAGASSLALLEPDVVKLNGALVRGVDRHAAKGELIRAMTEQCAQLGMRVVGECVETVGERDALLSAGCALMQGHLFARPDRGLLPPTFG